MQTIKDKSEKGETENNVKVELLDMPHVFGFGNEISKDFF